jgi:hypothetical protein
MPDTLPIINELWQSYPTGSVEHVKTTIGGRVDYGWIKNTCTIRVSRSLNYSGQPLPGPKNRYGLNVISGADGKWYAYRVKEFLVYLRGRYGAPSVSVSDSSSRKNLRSAVIGRVGIIVFEVSGWSDATGHVTLWDSGCADTCYFDKAHAVHLWETGYGPPRPVDMIVR